MNQDQKNVAGWWTVWLVFGYVTILAIMTLFKIGSLWFDQETRTPTERALEQCINDRGTPIFDTGGIDTNYKECRK